MRTIDKYKEYLDIGTNEGLRFANEFKSRYRSFNYCMDHLIKLNEQNPHMVRCVVELGTCRSFVDGKFEGCNDDNPKYWSPNDFSKWDWGGGCFSLVFGEFLKSWANHHIKLYTVDINPSHIRRCKIMTDSLGIECRHIVSNSLEFLPSFSQKIDLLYLDTGDMWPIKEAEELQLAEVKSIVEENHLTDDGLILIDDVMNGTPREQGDLNNTLGKSTLSLPYLLDHGFEVVFSGYQYILKKKK